MERLRLAVIAIISSLVVTACGGGSSNNPPPPPPPPPPPTVSFAEAFQFLNQATFGATEDEANRVVSMGIEAWIDQQMQLPVSLHLPFLQAVPPPPTPFELHDDRVDIWFRHALYSPDQLRQRVAFALSEIMVISQLSNVAGLPYGMADYYDMLARNSFGNYRDLIEDVTLHPAMGVYLSMLGNQKPDPATNIRPDENYARELMQLFSIGLVELNQDGSVVTDGMGIPVPTYNQAIIEGFAHVYTGWHWADAPAFTFAFPTNDNQVKPMQLYPAFHDDGEKTLLNGFVVQANQGGDVDLQQAMDNVFQHPNVGPFIAVRLIQRLTASNPSPGYISRVAAVFNDNGSGVRGDMGAVVKAILMDPEARPDIPMEIDGKIKEPLLRVTQLWRAYDAVSESGRIPLDFIFFFLGQGPLQSPSVFNFFSPFYAPPGEIQNASLVAPELGIATEYQNTQVTNFFFTLAFAWTSEGQAAGNLGPDDPYIDISEEMAIAADEDALIDMVADKLLAGDISQTLRDEIIGVLAIVPETDAAVRVGEVIFMITSSPEYAYQR